MRFKVNALLPCLTFFAAGDALRGVMALLMQVSLFLWPTAIRLAREFGETREVDRMLLELSAAYSVKDQVIPAAPLKQFRKAEGLVAAAAVVRQAA